MLRILGLPFICLAMFSVAGGHWAVFQAVAWAQMLRDYSQGATIAEAVGKTFSGEAPCAMCRKISEERQKEEKAPLTVKLDKKAEVFVASGGEGVERPDGRDFSYSTLGNAAVVARSEAPPSPVPILLS